MNIPLADLAAERIRLRDELDVAIAAVLDHGQFIMGPEVAELERELAGFCGARHALSCASGTDALVLALLALGIGPGDAVIVPSFTFCATAEAVALIGGTPVFADVSATTALIEADGVTAAGRVAAAAGLRVRAVMPVDLFGQPADPTTIAAAAAELGAVVVTDAAQSFGAMWDGRATGTLGQLSATSFFPAKPLGCFGDGGALFTNDDELADRVRSLRVHGQGRHKYDNVRIGINGRLDTLQAAVLLVKLPHLAAQTARRQAVADAYATRLTDGPVRPLEVDPRAASAWAQYTITCPDRDDLAARLAAADIGSAIYYPTPLHRQVAYKGFPATETPNSDWLSEHVLSLPMFPTLDEATIDRVCEVIQSR